jgi:hypothetical protein
MLAVIGGTGKDKVAEAVFAIDLWNAPHVSAPGLEVIFSQPSAHGLTGDTRPETDMQQFFRVSLRFTRWC